VVLHFLVYFLLLYVTDTYFFCNMFVSLNDLSCAVKKQHNDSMKFVFVVGSVQLNLMITLSFQGSWIWFHIQFKGWQNLKVCFMLCVFVVVFPVSLFIDVLFHASLLLSDLKLLLYLLYGSCRIQSSEGFLK